MLVEIYVGYGYGSGEWSTEYIEIPDVSDKTVNELIDDYMREHLNEFHDVVAFWGLYNIVGENTFDEE